VCDDGNSVNTDACLDTCIAATCGDTYVRAGVEQCDDGNAINTDACVAGCLTATCGDGFEQALVETCDDGNTDVETECPYGTTSDTVTTCEVCNATCDAPATLTGRYCGDGTVDGADGEQCDDDNTVCGTCDPTCSNATPDLAAAEGTISLPAATSLAKDGAIFTLNDGQNALIFELDRDNDCCVSNGRIKILLSDGDGAAAVATKTAAAINAQRDLSAISISASLAVPGTSTTVDLVNMMPGAFGNQTISKAGDSDFSVTGMTGGLGRDCDSGDQCASNDDCGLNLTCDTTTTFTCIP
jgi:cysteine-rich repeat protein